MICVTVQRMSWYGFMMWIIVLAVFGLKCCDGRRLKNDTQHYNTSTTTTTIDASAAGRHGDELDPLLLQQ